MDFLRDSAAEIGERLADVRRVVVGFIGVLRTDSKVSALLFNGLGSA